jgi:hypothetical protein
MGVELAQQNQKVTKIDRAQASQAQISMASFQGGADRPQSMSRKGTPVPGSDNASAGELEKLKNRVQEVEKILMAKEITMKTLGDPDEVSPSNAAGSKKSATKFDKDWTQKVEVKL